MVHFMGERCPSIVPGVSSIFHLPAKNSSLDFRSQPKSPRRRSDQVTGRGKVLLHELQYGLGHRAGSTAPRRGGVEDSAGYSAGTYRGLPVGELAENRRELEVNAPNRKGGLSSSQNTVLDRSCTAASRPLRVSAKRKVARRAREMRARQPGALPWSSRTQRCSCGFVRDRTSVQVLSLRAV